MKFITIDDIVRDICIVNLDNNMGMYARVLRAVRTAVDQVNLTYLPVVKSELVEVDTNLIAPLPQDVITVLKVGMITSTGRLTRLIQDPRIRREQYNTMTEDLPEFCDCEQPPTGVIEVPTFTPYQVSAGVFASSVFFNVSWNGTFYGELYAANNGMDSEGGWRYNEASNVLEMASGTLVEAGVKVLVEYKSASESYQLIPKVARTTITMYALYLIFSTDPGRSSFYMNEFRRHARQMKHDLAPFDLLAVTNAVLRGQKATVK